MARRVYARPSFACGVRAVANKGYHKGAHRRLGGMAIAAAEADPTYRCPRCGLTKAEALERWGIKGAKWIRGHRQRATYATSVADYQAEHARCSAGEGAAIRNALSSSAFDW